MAKLLSGSKVKPTVLANSNMDFWKKFDGKTLVEVENEVGLEDIKIGVSTAGISSLVLETKTQFIAIGFSKGMAQKVENDDVTKEDLINGVLSVRHRFNKGKDVEGDFNNYTGPIGISFGKPSGITLEMRSLLTEAVGKDI